MIWGLLLFLKLTGVGACSFKRNLSVPEKQIPLSKIYNCPRLSISISLQCKLTEIVNYRWVPKSLKKSRKINKIKMDTLDAIKAEFQKIIDPTISPGLHECEQPFLSKSNNKYNLYVLKYEHNNTINNILPIPKAQSIFITDTLTGCLFLAYNDKNELHVVHSNNQFSAALPNSKRFGIEILDNKITITRKKEDGEVRDYILENFDLNNIIYCCFPIATTDYQKPLPRQFQLYDVDYLNRQEKNCNIIGVNEGAKNWLFTCSVDPLQHKECYLI